MNSGTTSGASSGIITPPLAVYASAWLITVASTLVVRLAQVSIFPVAPLIMFVTFGVAISVLLSRVPLNETVRFALGVFDGALVFFTLTAQSFLNSLLGMATDPAIEIYLSLSFMWYLVLRSWLMVSLNAVAFQSVPALALFGLIATYILASEILWLFALFVLAMLFVMAVGHFYEVRLLRTRVHAEPILKASFAFGMLAVAFAFLVTPLLWFTLGRLVSTAVIGFPIRIHTGTAQKESMPDLMVGSGPTALSKMPVMRVKLEGVPHYPYLRSEVYNFYTGRGWNRIADFTYTYQPDHTGRVEFRMRYTPPKSMQATAHVRILSGWHNRIYTPGIPLELEAPIRSVNYVPRHGVLKLEYPLSTEYEYTIVAYAPLPIRDLLQGRHARFPHESLFDDVRRQYAPNISYAVEKLVRRLAQGVSSDYDKVLAFQKYIADNCKYNVNVEAYPSDVDVVEHFLFEAKEGYCVEFATALAVMCLADGMPARVVSGFLLKEREPETGEYLVREENRHLWTEVYFEGIGWVPFEATLGAQDVSPQATQMQAESDTSPQGKRSIERMLLDGLIALGALYLLYLVVPFAKSRSADSKRHRMPDRSIQRLLFYLQVAGAPPIPQGQTLNAYLEAVLPALRVRTPRFTEKVEALQRILPLWLYAPDEQARLYSSQIRAQMRAIGHTLLQEMGALRLILCALQIGWRRIYGNFVPATQG